MDLIPIKIKICRKNIGGKMTNDYPNFNELPGHVRGNMDWSYYIDSFGTGWHYDKISGFGEADAADSVDPDANLDTECQYGIIAVPSDFALEAMNRWPNRVQRITSTEFERFYDNRAHIHEPEEFIDKEVVEGIRTKYGVQGSMTNLPEAVKKSMTKHEQDCLDPNHPCNGIRKNYNKCWKDCKAKRKFNLIDD